MGKAANKINRREPATEVAEPIEPSSPDTVEALPSTAEAEANGQMEIDSISSAPELDETETDDIRSVSSHIRQTREEMGETINAIKAQVTPQHLAEEAKTAALTMADQKIEQAENAFHNTVDTARRVAGRAVESTRQALREPAQAARKTGAAIADTVQKKPALTALIGLGIGWFFVSRARKHRAMMRQMCEE